MKCRNMTIAALTVAFVVAAPLFAAAGGAYPWEMCPSNSIDAYQCCACEDSCQRDYNQCATIAITGAQRQACSEEWHACYWHCGCDAIFGVTPPTDPPSTE